MFGIGWPEMILIFIVALIAVGPKKLPELAKTLGKAMGELKKAGQELKDSIGLDEEIEQARRDAADAISGFQDAEANNSEDEMKSDTEGQANLVGPSAELPDRAGSELEVKKQDGQ
jgi:Tat protein translocase TatB subunit